MLIYENEGVRVIQHPHLILFHVQHWKLGDNPRSYGQSYDWRTVLETRSIDEVNNFVFKKEK